jgi:hypothetical protein
MGGKGGIEPVIREVGDFILGLETLQVDFFDGASSVEQIYAGIETRCDAVTDDVSQSPSVLVLLRHGDGALLSVTEIEVG